MRKEHEQALLRYREGAASFRALYPTLVQILAPKAAFMTQRWASRGVTRDDVMQELCIGALQALTDFDGRGSILGYVLWISPKHAAQSLRLRRQYEQPIETPWVEVDLTAEATTEARAELQLHISRLLRDDRERIVAEFYMRTGDAGAAADLIVEDDASFSRLGVKTRSRSSIKTLVNRTMNDIKSRAQRALKQEQAWI